MSLLVKNTTPAERRRGCTFSDKPYSAVQVGKNNGHLFGAPTFSEAGITLDGAADYVGYDIQGTEFNSDPLSIVIEFTPDFDDSEDVQRYFYSSGAPHVCYKGASGQAYGIDIKVGNTWLTRIAQATYQDYWLQGQRNVLVLSLSSASNDAWLNGTQIMTAEGTAWTADPSTAMTIGAGAAGGNKFDGTFHSVSIYKAKLTAKEAKDFYDQTVYTYMDSVKGLWQMRAEDHDPTASLTLDSSGNGYDLTGVHDPVKLASHGYNFDGANDYFSRVDASGAFSPTGDFTVAGIVIPSAVGGTDYIVSKYDWTTPQRCWKIQTNNANLNLTVSNDGTASATANSVGGVIIGKPIVFVGVYDLSETEGRLYVNDLPVGVQGTMPGPAFAATVDFVVGSRHAHNDHFPGDILLIAYWDDLVLTPLQVEDLKVKLWKQVNDV